MELETLGGEASIKNLIHNIRSIDETVRKSTISQIPNLILESLKQKSDILNQLLLVIYNLNTDSDNYEILNATSRTFVIRRLLRLYTETIQEHSHDQIDALIQIIDFVHSSELLVEVAYALHKCDDKELDKEYVDKVEAALSQIRDKAAANLYSEALLMIHSIIATKQANL